MKVTKEEFLRIYASQIIQTLRDGLPDEDILVKMFHNTEALINEFSAHKKRTIHIAMQRIVK